MGYHSGPHLPHYPTTPGTTTPAPTTPGTLAGTQRGTGPVRQAPFGYNNSRENPFILNPCFINDKKPPKTGKTGLLTKD